MTAFTEMLPRVSGSVGTARRLVEIHGTGLSAKQREDAGLMASELVTNALLHGAGAITLRITSGPDDVLFEVADEGHGRIAIIPTPGLVGGWGLRLVDQLADSWGARDGSTCAWFRLVLAPV